MYENGSRIRPTRPAPAIPMGLSRNSARRSAPVPPRRQSTLNENVSATNHSDLSQQPPRRSAPNLERQNSIEDNTQNVREKKNNCQNVPNENRVKFCLFRLSICY